ncbi:MAG: thiamine-phosphate kinase [Pseudomonadota bacterium]
MAAKTPIPSEDELIDRYLRPLAEANPAALDLRDDAACLTPAPGHDLALTKDALVAGVHFLPDDDAFAVGIKVLTVNLSDLLAKGAEPKGYLLALALPPTVDEAWLESFSCGFAENGAGKLLGGDLTRTDGPLVITVTAIGEVPHGRMVRRDGARSGDHVFLSGQIGTSYLGLRYQKDLPEAKRHGLSAAEISELARHYAAPMIPFFYDVWPLVREFASAALDVSDGLIRDAGRLLKASNVGAELDAAAVALHRTAQRVVDVGHIDRRDLFTGGDDYCVLMTVPDDRLDAFNAALAEVNHGFHAIGRIGSADTGLIVRNAEGVPMVFETRGHDHFAKS